MGHIDGKKFQWRGVLGYKVGYLMILCPALMKKCEQMSDYNFEFNSSCAPILKINLKNYFRLFVILELFL